MFQFIAKLLNHLFFLLKPREQNLSLELMILNSFFRFRSSSNKVLSSDLRFYDAFFHLECQKIEDLISFSDVIEPNHLISRYFDFFQKTANLRFVFQTYLF